MRSLKISILKISKENEITKTKCTKRQKKETVNITIRSIN